MGSAEKKMQTITEPTQCTNPKSPAFVYAVLRLLSPDHICVGAQGGEAEECARAAANDQGGGFVINSSRGIIYASRNPEDFDYEAGRAAELLRNQINDALKPDGLNPQTISLE